MEAINLLFIIFIFDTEEERLILADFYNDNLVTGGPLFFP